MSDAAKLIGNSESSRSEVGLVNGNYKSEKDQPECDSSESTAVSISLTSSTPSARPEDVFNHRTSCTCSCDPKDFRTSKQSSQEVRKETCKLVESVDELFSINRPNSTPATNTNHSISHKNCHCNCEKRKSATPDVTPTNGDASDDTDDWSLMLIGLAQLHPATSLVRLDPFDALPSISVVPPTPEGLFSQFCGSPNFEQSRSIVGDVKRGRVDQLIEQANDVTPDDSPQDEEPPYRSLNATLKRYGTMSSLEQFSSEEKEEKAYNSSEEENEVVVEDADSELFKMFKQILHSIYIDCISRCSNYYKRNLRNRIRRRTKLVQPGWHILGAIPRIPRQLSGTMGSCWHGRRSW